MRRFFALGGLFASLTDVYQQGVHRERPRFIQRYHRHEIAQYRAHKAANSDGKTIYLQKMTSALVLSRQKSLVFQRFRVAPRENFIPLFSLYHTAAARRKPGSVTYRCCRSQYVRKRRGHARQISSWTPYSAAAPLSAYARAGRYSSAARPRHTRAPARKGSPR